MSIKGKVQGWWYDTCAIMHVSYDKSTSKTYSKVNDGQEVQMGNEVRFRVVRTRSVELNFTSEKKVTLFIILHEMLLNEDMQLLENVVVGETTHLAERMLFHQRSQLYETTQT